MRNRSLPLKRWESIADSDAAGNDDEHDAAGDVVCAARDLLAVLAVDDAEVSTHTTD